MEAECKCYLSDEFVTKSLQGKLLYKDQCTKCFTDPKTDYIDLCLKCFNGSCGAHSQEHFENFGHSVVLQIQVRQDEEKVNEHKKLQEQNAGQEITKLAIGKAGGLVDFDSNEFQKTIYKVKCLKCKVDIPNEKLEGVIKSIEQTDSAFKKQDLVAWEAEIYPCEHSLTLQQEPNIRVKNMAGATCADCDLSTNLWMCLQCGNLGCGRKNYDGTGGNNHGIDHGEKTGHSLVVKLGTITPNGDASLYCYTCNNDVKDEYLPQHLANLGLNINDQKKTEKTMAEMNLDLNLNVTLSSIIEEGKILEPVFGPDFTGLVNLGNSCYINSVLQAVFHLDEFKQTYFLEGVKHMQQCKKLPAECYYCQFSKLGEGLISGKYSIKKSVELPDGREKELPENQRYAQDGIKIYDLKKLIATNHQEFSTNRMQDAFEYFQHLLQFIQKNEKQCKLPDITEIFKFKQTTRLKCMECGGVKYNEIKTSELKLPVRVPNQEELKQILEEKQKRQEQQKKQEEEKKEIKVNMEDPEYKVKFEESTNMFKEGEIIQVNCSKCNKNTNFHSGTYFKTLPKYLVVPMQRFVLENWVPCKLNALIDMPESVDFNELILKPQEGEELLPQQEQQSKGPNVNEVALEMLMQMGMSKNRCIRALLANNNDPDAATNWMFERMDDPSLDDPIEEEGAKKQDSQFSPENIQMIRDMGFSEKAAKIALQNCDNNVERAIDFLFNHDNVENMELEQEQPKKEEKDESLDDLLKRSQYELTGAIVHLGTRYDSGHYVVYLKIQGQWYLFNDTKVAKTPEPVLGKGYIYLFQRK